MLKNKSILFFVFTVAVFGELPWQEELQQKIKSRPPSWMRKQIQSDLASFDPISLRSEHLDDTLREDRAHNSRWHLARYRISDGILSADFSGAVPYHERGLAIKNALQELLGCVPLPNVDFLVSLDDEIYGAEYFAPVFVFAKNASVPNRLILIPDFEALQGNISILEEVKHGIQQFPWEKKIDRMIWRGNTTGFIIWTADVFLSIPRSQLITHSLEHPDLIDAKFHAICQTDDVEQVQTTFAHYFGEHMPVYQHIAYKYQMLIDGNTCAYSRAYWQLFSNCLIFKPDSPHIQWYYRALKPNVHYIPCHANLSDLVEKIQWARSHDHQAKQMGKQAKKFAEKNLKQSDVYLYLALLLQEYAKLQTSDELATVH